MNLRSLLIFCLVLLAARVDAAKPRRTGIHYKNSADTTCLFRSYADSLRLFRAAQDTAMATTQAEGGHPGRLYRLFVPVTFYHSAARDMFRDSSAADTLAPYIPEVNRVLMSVYLNSPWLVRSTDRLLDKALEVREEIGAPINNKVDLVEKVPFQPEEDDFMPYDVVVKKPYFWTFGGDYYLQFLQNYVSTNWYKGGESNYSMVASATLTADYNNKQKLKFSNKLEMKLGFQTSKGDTLHNMKTSEDLFRYTGKLGLQATKKWYYTLQVLAYTQFMRGYKSNDHFVYSDIMSPFNVNVSLGMDYNVSWFEKKLTGNMQMAPLAYNFRYVGRLNLATNYGLDEGRHTMNDFGSEFTVDLTWKFSDMIRWKTRLYGYTTYKRAELEWENTFTFQFNRYISSNIFVYPRFDDGASTRDKNHGYWQFKEYASIGFSYNF